MRQLWQTGWQHNRVRMVTASFLIKHLLIDWREGEKWFHDTLVDADPASNAASWQWVAGSAILGGGCFWCIESDFEKLPGVYESVSGYSGDDMQNPTYRNHGKHVEVVKVTFDPTVISYDEILDYYWRHIDPTDNGGQFCDRGNAYIPVIYARPDQLAQAKASKAEIEEIKPFSDPIRVPILPAKTFWKAALTAA